MESTNFPASAHHLSQARHVRLKWTHAALAPAITMLPVHHRPIIVIFSAPARLASQEDFAMKTSMNVKRTTHAEMEAPV